MKKKKLKIGKEVIVSDNKLFKKFIKGVIVTLDLKNDVIQLQVTESKDLRHPVGCDTVWVSRKQVTDNEEEY